MNILTTNEKVKIVKDLIKEVKHTLEFEDKINEVLGIYTDGKLFELHMRLLDYSIDLTIKLIGDHEEDPWLIWYIWENAMGANGYKSYISDKKAKVIDTPKKLVKLIEEYPDGYKR